MAAASAVASSSRALEHHRSASPEFSAEASSSRAAEARPVSCEEGVFDLDSPWAAAAVAESRLEEAAAGLNLLAEEEAGEAQIRDNQQRQEDEV